MKANILLIEDDDALAMGLEFLFKQEGMNVTRACDCKSARAAFSGASYDLIVLDITLPDGNGFDLCRDFRASSDTPILFLTALDDELSQVRALDGGGDDYVTKPFALKVLVSRVNALLRRGARSGGEGRDELANLRMDAGQMKCYVDGRDVGLTATEWKLLWALRQNRDEHRHTPRIALSHTVRHNTRIAGGVGRGGTCIHAAGRCARVRNAHTGRAGGTGR